MNARYHLPPELSRRAVEFQAPVDAPGDSPVDSTMQLLKGAGFEIDLRNGGRHWIISGHRLRLNHWPYSQKWMCFGKVWISGVERVVQAIRDGRIRMPDDARPATCRHCSTSIWWVTTDRGRRMAIQADGDGHFSRCPAEVSS